MAQGVAAAVETARSLGIETETPVLIQETNNTVVWLRPHHVIAKAGAHADSAAILAHEHWVASALARLGAPVAAPLEGTGVYFHEKTGCTVTLWQRLEQTSAASEETPGAVGESLRVLHQAFAQANLDLPPLVSLFTRVRPFLFSDRTMAALGQEDRLFLRRAFVDLMQQLDRYRFTEQGLHGEPHEANWLYTPAGIRWLDFEDACRGPLEWDLLFLPEPGLAAFPVVDFTLLEILRTLDAVRRGTWAWVQARFPEMRSFGEEQLALVRARWP